MKHAVRRILLLIIVVFLLVAGGLLRQGYVRYQEEIAANPIEKSVAHYTEQENYVRFEDIDEDFVHAVISVEDKRFFERKGYDFIALFRALYANFRARRLVEGGSTISEQIAKNLYLNGKVIGIEDKMAEIWLMFHLEKVYTKEELFALYANMNYYGDGHWGIRQAAEGYFDVSPSDLTLAEAAMLAGIPNAPAIYQLSTGYELAKERQEWVLSTMVRNGYISEEESAAAAAEPIYEP